MTRDEVAEKVLVIVRERLGNDEITETYEFGGPGDDSLDNVGIVIEIEDFFDIIIPEDDVKKLKTVGQTINYIFEKLSPSK